MLIGASGFNLGDDAIAVALHEQLTGILTGAEIRVASINPGRLAPNGIDEFVIDRRSIGGWIALVKAIRRSDLVLLGGGTLIQDALGCGLITGMIPYIWQVTLLARLCRRRVATVPIGIDKLSGPRAARLAKQILRWATPVLLRDQASFELARAMVPDARVPIFSADPVFNVTGFGQEGSEKPPYIVVSYVREHRSPEQLQQELSAIVAGIRERWPDREVVLLAMDTRELEELSIYQMVASTIDDRKVRIESPTDFRVAMGILRGAQLVVAMRLHAMILALGHVPLVGISRTTKTDTLMKDASIYGVRVEVVDAGSLGELMQQAISDEARVARQMDFAKASAQRFRATMRQLVTATGMTASDEAVHAGEQELRHRAIDNSRAD